MLGKSESDLVKTGETRDGTVEPAEPQTTRAETPKEETSTVKQKK